MSNTFGFGGHNACVIFKEVDYHKKFSYQKNFKT